MAGRTYTLADVHDWPQGARFRVDNILYTQERQEPGSRADVQPQCDRHSRQSRVGAVVTDDRRRVKIMFTKTNGRPGSVLEPLPSRWDSLNEGQRDVWAIQVARRVHPGSTDVTYQEQP